ncbi:MAG: cation:proton antiporter [Planctomycetales bacterium]|nr:cation:proton antiporter [Planctomycetales bacterium]
MAACLGTRIASTDHRLLPLLFWSNERFHLKRTTCSIVIGCVLALAALFGIGHPQVGNEWSVALAFGDEGHPAISGQQNTSPSNSTSAPATGHEDPVTPLLLGISIILLAAKIGGDLMVRLKQPAVLGELLVGVVLGNLALFGFDGLEFLRPAAGHGELLAIGKGSLAATTLDMLARIGVILLLFEVGLESNLNDMRRVGASSLIVAVLGAVTPMALGWGVSRWLLPNHSWHVHLFIGATLCATSVGITARVLKDIGKTDTREAQIILGAAVIDDVLGLVILAVVQAIIVQGSASALEVAVIIGKALGFLVGSFLLGEWLSPRLFGVAAKLRVHGMLVITGLVFCFLMSWLASFVGLAPIVGAFAAGLILDERHYVALHVRDERSLEDLVLPITTLLVPIFFVMMGFQVDLKSFLNPSMLFLAAGITVAAIVGKQACSLGVRRDVDRLSVGFGMIPRGEVGLIFAAIGQGLRSGGEPVIDAAVYTAIVVMVMATTLATPPLLNWSLTRHDKN